MLQLLGFMVAVGCLGYAAFCDFKTREVPDWVWVLMGGLGGGVSAVRLLLGGLEPLTLAVSLGVTGGLAFAFGFLHMWGGADVKAFTCLAATVPDWPGFTLPGLRFFPYPAAVVFAACLLSLACTSPLCLAKNLAWKLKGRSLFQGLEYESPASKLACLLLTFKAEAWKVKGSISLTPAEVVDEDGVRRLKISLTVPREDEPARVPEGFVFANPQLPLLTYTLPALILTAILGDPLAAIMAALFSLF